MHSGLSQGGLPWRTGQTISRDRSLTLMQIKRGNDLRQRGEGRAQPGSIVWETIASCGPSASARASGRPQLRRSEIRQVRVLGQAQLEPAEMRVGILGAEADMHRREMDVTPGALDRMRFGEPGRAAHCD